MPSPRTRQATTSGEFRALLKTIGLKDPVRSGQQMAVYPAGWPTRSAAAGRSCSGSGISAWARPTAETFNEDLYAFPPATRVTAGDLGLAVPAKIMRHIWAALKKLDTIVPGVLHPSTIMYYPEIKMYANKPVFLDRHFRVSGNVFMVGDLCRHLGARHHRRLGERHPGGGGDIGN